MAKTMCKTKTPKHKNRKHAKTKRTHTKRRQMKGGSPKLDNAIEKSKRWHKAQFNQSFYLGMVDYLKEINSLKTMEDLIQVKNRVSLNRDMYNHTVVGVLIDEQSEALDLLLKKIEEKEKTLAKNTRKRTTLAKNTRKKWQL